MRLAEDTFTSALMDPGQAVPDGLGDGALHPAGRRFDVYRNNVTVSLTEALHTGFPVITKLIGVENMDGIAGLFLRARPPDSPVLSRYGTSFPDFLAATKQLAHLGYLPDIARLELAIRRAYHAADAIPIDPDILTSVSAETLMGMTVSFAPAVQLVRSNWPIYDIWRFNTQDDAPKPQAGAQDVLVTRPEFDPIPQLLVPGGAIWIEGLMNGQTIGAAFDDAQTAAPDFDLTAPLTLLLRDGALLSLNSKG